MRVIGARQLSRYLCRIATGLDYHVTVCDPRDEHTDVWDVPGTTLVRTMPDDTVLDMRLDERSAVMALTHDPKLDDLALMEALKTRAFYVGALGSRRNNAARRERLREFDLSDAFASGVCVIGSQFALYAVSRMVYPTALRSTGVGSAIGIGELGSVAGSTLGGVLLAMHLPVSTLFADLATVFIFVALLAAWLGGVRRGSSSAASSQAQSAME
jgi:hypothetical protein